jgi:hypothetical protein
MDYRYFGYAIFIFIFLRVTISTKKSISEAKVNLFFTFKEEYIHTKPKNINRKYCNNFLLNAIYIHHNNRYELIYIAYIGPSGFIQSDSWDIVIDLWIDSLGALAICFLYDEFTES